MRGRGGLFGVLAEFERKEDLLAAARKVHAEGYRKVEAYAPFPVEGLAEALGMDRTRLPWVVLAGGLTGAAGGFFMQVFASAVDDPLNIGGRPTASWPAFVVIAFELAILFGGLSALLGMLALNGLPQPYHPVFNVPRFALASQDRFFLSVEADDPRFDPDRTRTLLAELRPVGIYDVER
jgi:hypothetical protein